MDTVTYGQTQIWAGRHPETNGETIAMGQNLVALAPLGRVKATGELKIWAPAAVDGTEKAIRITPYAIDATGAALDKEVYYSGTIISDAIAWPEGTTEAQKAGAFDGSLIVLGKLA